MFKQPLTAFLVFLSFSLALIFSPASADEFAGRELQLVASDYKLDFDIDYDQEKLRARGTVTVTNISDQAADHIPFNLYRLMKVTDITDEKGEKLAFSQEIRDFTGWSNLQSRYVEIALNDPIRPGASRTFSLSYAGYLKGYVETGMLYVKDSITPDFTILRMDALAYPLIGYPDMTVNKKARFWTHTYNYQVSITVPEGYVVANGGTLMDKTIRDGLVSYRYQNYKPAWRMDFAIAKYDYMEKDGYRIFSLETGEKTRKILDEMVVTVELYSKWFGPLANDKGFAVIEVPQGYGSQADVTAVIQTADAFKDLNDLDQVYHEVSHKWNVNGLDQFRPRWNEGLATYLQSLTMDRLHKPGHLSETTARIFSRLKKSFAKNPLYGKTAYRDYGKAGLSSYSVGMIFFHLMSDIAGEEDFNKIIGGFYRTYHKTGATTDQFMAYCRKVTGVKLDGLFQDWANGTDYVKRVIKADDYPDLLGYYK